MKLGEKIRNKRKELGLTQEQLGELIGVKKSAIAKYENNRVENLKRPTIQKLANIFNVSPSFFFDEEEHTNLSPADVHFIPVPLYEPISCGNGGFVDDNIIEYIPVPDDGLRPGYDYFAQTAVGDSMKDAGIDDGDILIFARSQTIDNGQIGCFCLDDNIATCKRFMRDGAYIQLIPMNSRYDPIVIDLENTNFRVVGILKKSIKEFR